MTGEANMLLKALKHPSPAGLVMIAALALSGTALATHEPVPASEAGRFSPEQLRGLLSGPVQVAERKVGHYRGTLLIRRFTDGGHWAGCAISPKGKAWTQAGGWSVAADSRGRGKLFAHRHHLTAAYVHHTNPVVVHYEPGTGRLLWRKSPSHDVTAGEAARGWQDWNDGWVQARWPRIAVAKCPDLDLAGIAVDGRQTGETLEELRKQASDAALKDLEATAIGVSGVARTETSQETGGKECPVKEGRASTCF